MITDLQSAAARLLNAVHELRLEGNDPTLRAACADVVAALAQPEPEGLHPIPVLPEGIKVIEPTEHTLLVPVAQPIPVSERLPGPEDCDAEGRCWIHMPDIGTNPSWRLVDPRDIGRYHTHWLPAHALPQPQWKGLIP